MKGTKMRILKEIGFLDGMKGSKGFKPFLFAVLMLSFCLLFGKAKAQETVWGESSNSEYIQTARDTVTLPTAYGVKIKGLITNQDATNDLIVYFGDASGTLDSNAYFSLAPGKTLHFETTGSTIFRNASADSVFSQVLIGNVSLSYIDKYEETVTYISTDTGIPDGVPDRRKYIRERFPQSAFARAVIKKA